MRECVDGVVKRSLGVDRCERGYRRVTRSIRRVRVSRRSRRDS